MCRQESLPCRKDHNIPDFIESTTFLISREFGDLHTTAIDEVWYKSAVLQHQVEPETFVFSVNFSAWQHWQPEEVVVTASHAVFPRDGGLQAPAAVLGYQFSHHLLVRRFMEITSKAKVKNIYSYLLYFRFCT